MQQKIHYNYYEKINSISNYLILQSALNINEIINTYGFFTKKLKYIIFSKTSQNSKQPTKITKNIINNNSTYNKKYIGCAKI